MDIRLTGGVSRRVRNEETVSSYWWLYVRTDIRHHGVAGIATDLQPTVQSPRDAAGDSRGVRARSVRSLSADKPVIRPVDIP